LKFSLFHTHLSRSFRRAFRLISLVLFAALSLNSCGNNVPDNPGRAELPEQPFLVILGTVQDAGLPQLGCRKACCRKYEGNKDPDKNVVALGLIDPVDEESFLFEATPDINRQLEIMNKYISSAGFTIPDGIFLSHAHIGHYAGLLQLGRESNNAKDVPVFAMPRMTKFLNNNGPWDQLVSLGNILLKPLHQGSEVKLNDQLTVLPLLVPHRDEYSETVGFIISGPNKKALFVPDIDKWNLWKTDIDQLISQVDYAFLDATFYDENEIKNRDMGEIPHPFVVESMDRFSKLSKQDKAKVYFIHFNHTNPLLDTGSPAYQQVLDEGYRIAETHQLFPL